MLQEVFIHDGVSVGYQMRPQKQDRKHLTVIFSGFRKKGTYDFDGMAIQSLRGAILWIQDLFNDEFSYYLYSNKKNLTGAVYALIESKLQEMGLDKHHVTLAGFSKGGSAALYYAAKYGFSNVLITVPQFRIGSYLKNKAPKVLDSMLPRYEDSVGKLDNILTTILQNDNHLSKNIYLFTSPADDQYISEIIPNLHLFDKYHNFNCIVSDTPFIEEHDRVTWYNVPMILSILSALVEGAPPRHGLIKNGSRNFQSNTAQPTLAELRQEKNHLFGLSRLEIQRGRLYIDGYSFIQGYSAEKYSDISTSIRIENSSQEYLVRMGGVEKKELTMRNFRIQVCDYSRAGFASIGHEGIDLSELPDGRYKLSLETSHALQTVQTVGPIFRGKKTREVKGESIYELSYDSSGTFLSKRNIRNKADYGSLLSLKKTWVADDRLHVEGYFVVPGQVTPNWNDISYYLLLINSDDQSLTAVISLSNAERSDIGKMINDEWNDYSKSYFATLKYQGLSLTGLAPGGYELSITAISRELVVSRSLGVGVDVTGTFGDYVSRPTVGVIGSCVTRDLFNSRLVPDWKNFYAFHGAQYQMSLVSLMSAPVDRRQLDFNDLDEHSRIATESDFDKTYLLELKRSQPNVLIFDFFSDARFGCLAVKDSFITDNSWKLGESAAYSDFSIYVKYSRTSNEDEFIDLFRESAIKFRNFAAINLPQTRIILNSARGVRGYYERGQLKLFAQQNLFNSFWDKLDRIFTEVMGCQALIGNSDQMMSSAVHPWGPANVHYEPAFYDKTHKQLRQLLGYGVSLELNRKIENLNQCR